MSLLKRVILACALLLPAESFANGQGENLNPIPPFLNITAPNQLDGVSINPNTAAAGNFTTLSASGLLSPSGGTAPSGTVFSTALTGNPLVLDNSANTLVSTVGLNSAATTLLVASTAGRTIYPIGVTIMASGAAATATGLAIECSDGTLIASWPVALLTSLNPLNAYSSTAVGRGKALGTGCPASTGIVLSNVGTNVTTTTFVGTNVLYTDQ